MDILTNYTIIRKNLSQIIKENHSCRHVHEIINLYDRCKFVRETESCSYDGIIYNYTELTFCQFMNLRVLSLIVLFSILAILFISVGTVADDFLCPSLLTISKTLRLPDNIAGVTFLAFGNGAPDIFASIGGISHSKPQLIFSSLYGAGIFVTTVVTGSVLLTGEFTVMKRPLVRDIVFYIGATFIVWLFIYQRVFKISHAIALICYYIIYILVIIISRFIFLRMDRKSEESSTTDLNGQIPNIDELEVHSRSNRTSFAVPDSRKTSIVSFNSSVSGKSRRDSIDDDVILARFYRTGTMRSTRSRTHSETRQHFAHHHWSNTMRTVSKAFESAEEGQRRHSHAIGHVFHVENHHHKSIAPVLKKKGYTDEIILPKQKPKFTTQLSVMSVEKMTKFFSESKNFIIHVCPIDILEWNEYSMYKKVFELIRSVPYFVLNLCIPVVDLESVNHNWCRFLICLNVLLGPQAVLFIKQIDMEVYDNFPLWSLCLIISLVLIIIILLTSDQNKPPIYHRLFAFVGFVISVLFINAIADEVISILQTFGIIFKLTDSILGLTILAWGNSLGDLISNLSMARHGYHGMAIAACYGGPMLNLLMGLGLPYLFMFVRHENEIVHLRYTHMISLLYGTIALSLCISLVSFIIRRFKSSKIHGLLLITLYVCYFITAIVFEFKHLNK